MINIPMKINSEKKHSIRYDAVSDNAAVSSVYIMNHSLPTPYPQNIVISVIHEQSEILTLDDHVKMGMDAEQECNDISYGN